VKDELIERNPRMITGAMYAKTKSSISILEVGEIAALADAIKPERFKALILISAWCGLRYGEVTELRRKDIGEGAEVISIARGVVHREGCHISTPKSGKARTVVVPPHIRAEIKHRLDTFVAEDVEALLFPPVRSGCHLSDKVNRDALAPALKSVGCEGVRIHDLRHFSGTEVARVGNLVETMNHPGHATVTASLRYQQRSDVSKRLRPARSARLLRAASVTVTPCGGARLRRSIQVAIEPRRRVALALRFHHVYWGRVCSLKGDFMRSWPHRGDRPRKGGKESTSGTPGRPADRRAG
jgi:integrase